MSALTGMIPIAGLEAENATLRETLEAYKEANDIISRVGYVDGLNAALDKEAKRAATLAEENATLRARCEAHEVAYAELATLFERQRLINRVELKMDLLGGES